MSERYISKPQHLLWAALFLAAGAATVPLEEGWGWFGISMLLMGTLTWVWVIFSGMWHSYESYWREIANVAEVLNKTKDPEVWAAFGFVRDVSKFTAEISEQDKSGYGLTEKFDLPGSQTQFQTFADGILMKRPMSETEWGGAGKLYTVPVFRSLKKELELRKYIKLRYDGKPTLGFELTRKGNEFFLKYASDGIKLLLLDQRKIATPEPVPMLN